jgi:hypothetical protein
MEDARFPVPLDLREVTHAERAEVAQLITAAEQAVRSAEFAFRGTNGDYFLHLENSVDVADDADSAAIHHLSLVRDLLAGNTYNATVGTDNNPSVATVAGQNLVGPGVVETMAAAQAVDEGQVRGKHRVSVGKLLEHEGDTAPMMMFIDLAYVSDGQLFPITTIDLRMCRGYAENDGTIVQSRRIEIDPNTGKIRTGDDLSGEQWAQRDEHQAYEGWVRIADPFPEMTAGRLQNQFYPAVPLTEPIDSATWLRLIKAPLDPRDQLKN